jgi:DNA-binding MurR/RpiR family transcriptional regulator
MPKTKTIPVRLDPVLLARLDRLAKATGLSRSAVIKFCVSTFTEAIPDLRGPYLEQLKEKLHQLDGRTHRYAENFQGVEQEAPEIQADAEKKAAPRRRGR